MLRLFRAGTIPLVLALFFLPVLASADTTLFITKDSMGVEDSGGSGNRGNSHFSTPPRNVNGTAGQGENSQNYPMPEVQVYVPWHGGQHPGPHPGGQQMRPDRPRQQRPQQVRPGRHPQQWGQQPGGRPDHSQPGKQGTFVPPPSGGSQRPMQP